jgi:hypothetical protein
MAADPPVPRVVKAADTWALLALEDTAEVRRVHAEPV